MGCSDSQRPVRVGVLVDCTGIIAPTHEWALAAAELPLLQRGGTLGRSGADGGVHGAEVDGHPIQLIEGCSETGVYGRLIQETRRLVQDQHVDVVVGATGWNDGIVFRDLARLFPTVPFVVAASWPREVTARDPPPNLFRFEPDVEQSQAGLADYAYHHLGWRHVAAVAEDEVMGWGSVAAFDRQFCALGGSVTNLWVPFFNGSEPISRIPATADGVAVFENYGYAVPAGFLRAYARAHSDIGRLLLLSLWYYPSTDRKPMAKVWPLLSGVAGSIQGTADPASPAMTANIKAYARAFPSIPPAFSTEPDVLPFRDAMSAVLQALDATGGDVGVDRATLRAALARVRLATPYGAVTLDRHHQAMIANRLVSIASATGTGPTLRTAEMVPHVGQSLDGLFRPEEQPTRTAGCSASSP